MGGHTNYWELIRTAIKIKEEFVRIKLPRLQELIKLLKTKEILIDEEGLEAVPSNKELAKELEITVPKCNKLLKELRDNLLDDFREEPLRIKKVVHEIMIWLPREEIRHNKEYFQERSNYIQIVLPQTQRVGEHIRLDFFKRDVFLWGSVHEVRHVIEGDTQFVEVFVHPMNDVYYKWQELKQEYEYEQRRRRRSEYE